MQLPVLEQPEARTNATVDLQSLHDTLTQTTNAEVRFDKGSRAAYATDASNYRRVPTAVVIPRTTEDIVAAVAACRKHRVPIVSRGGGTSLTGQCCTHGVVLDCSKHLNKILDIDPKARTARVQPGVVLDTLNDKIKREHNLAFGPDPSTHSHCTFGGMLGNDSCGVHSILGGQTSANIISMKVLTSDGHTLTVGPTTEDDFRQRIAEGGRIAEIYQGLRDIRDRHADAINQHFPDIPRRVSGYNLPALLDDDCNIARALVGSEGTCVAILEATLRLVEWPKARCLAVLGYQTIADAAEHIMQIMETGPIGLEGLDDRLVQYMRLKGMHPHDVELLPEGHAWLLVEYGADTPDEAEDKARHIKQRLNNTDNPPIIEVITDEAQAARIWEVRESGLGATAFIPGTHDNWPGWEDASVPPWNLPSYLRKFRHLLRDHGYDCSLYGHFGQGCVHCRINFDLVTPSGIDNYKAFVHKAADLVLEHGGCLSAEHGDGLAKSELLPKMFGDELMEAFARFKRLWDPDNIMNPGKVVATPPLDTDLRFGPHYQPRRLETEFSYPDAGTTMFERAAVRCVGVGKCRRRDDAFMCPSYIATQEELDSTRGRARLLFEMTRGDTITNGWQSEEVRDSLDLCLGCKGCKKECPVSVDMATYKAEFLYHHYKHRPRPRPFYAMGFIGALADLAAIAPPLANFAASAPGLRRLSKWCAGVAQDRELPRFANKTARRQLHRRTAINSAANRPRGDIVLIPDAFNDHFFPDALVAAADTLEHLGYRVRLPKWNYPAIRPLIHYGFLPRARRHLAHTITRLDEEAATHGTPIIGLEPSTVAVLRDEAEGLFPKSPPAERVANQARLLSEFLAERHLDDLPQTTGRCVLHAHCHQKAVLDANSTRRVLEHMGYQVTEPEPGCCGMAGSFGFEAKHADLARRIGENRLFPAVRKAPETDPIVIEGFSCREQIKQDTARTPVHIAELVAHHIKNR